MSNTTDLPRRYKHRIVITEISSNETQSGVKYQPHVLFYRRLFNRELSVYAVHNGADPETVTNTFLFQPRVDGSFREGATFITHEAAFQATERAVTNYLRNHLFKSTSIVYEAVKVEEWSDKLDW